MMATTSTVKCPRIAVAVYTLAASDHCLFAADEKSVWKNCAK
jgi:hypothetical protein